ncbi:MAG: DNA polymerase III subunit delta [Steroidobacteraceae bacterium]|jgi:DNA polymerase-3 subunit delta
MAGYGVLHALKLTPESLTAHLAGSLLPIYLVSGDEPLLCAESADAIRASARAAGFSERQVFFIDRTGAPWDELLQSAQSMSLFTERRLLEIRMPSGRPGTGAARLLKLLEAAGPELMLLILTGKLDREVADSEWARLAQARGGWVPIWPVAAAQFPQWMRQRLRGAGIEVSEEALQLLVQRTEGNLLAAQQEAEKLALLLGPGARAGIAEIAASSGESARFNHFQLADACAAMDAERALRVLDGLRAEGAEALLVLWALARELRSRQSGRGGGGGAYGSRTIRASGNTRQAPFARLTMRAARADRMAKGMLHGDVWDELALLTTELCGRRTLPLPRWQAAR